VNANRYLVKTLGCKANLYDSQLIEAELQRRGWLPAGPAAEGAPAQLCIVNSCTVTDEADRQSRKLASRLARDNPGARVVLTGCAAEVDPERLAGTSGVHYVVGNRDKPRMIDLVLAELARPAPGRAEAQVLGVAEGYAEMASRHPHEREWPLAESMLPGAAGRASLGDTRRTRAFLKIQDGCNSFCTYCVIPYGRGPSRSLPIGEVTEQVRALVAQGAREVVITGINIGDYGTDWSEGAQIVPLIEAILRDTTLERLRVSSLDPVEIEDALTELARREPRFCPHFHVSLQSPVTRVLRLMKRKYTTEHAAECLARIAALPAPAGGAFVGMDVIAGFPGETEADFERGVEWLRAWPWSRLHVFPYSERAGTPATRLPGSVPVGERMRRARVLRDLSLIRLREIHERAIGRKITALMERPSRGPAGGKLWVPGHTANYLRVLVAVDDEIAAERLLNCQVEVEPTEIWVDEAAGEVSLLAHSAPILL
jgi:threonylcarbamoyladenosine tRNA methylthiotransferase MtaB